MAKTNNDTTAPAATETPAAQASSPARVCVRILKNDIHAEGCRFRAGARVKLAADIAEKMINDKVAVRLPDYY